MSVLCLAEPGDEIDSNNSPINLAVPTHLTVTSKGGTRTGGYKYWIIDLGGILLI
jgi:hypothetical protein